MGYSIAKHNHSKHILFALAILWHVNCSHHMTMSSVR